MKSAVEKIHKEMCSGKKFNAEMSGTTLTSVLISGNQLFTCNVGDSRTILVSTVDRTFGAIGLFHVQQLTKDHKPGDEEEMKRIESAGGIVQQTRVRGDELHGPLRIYNKAHTSPGLSMSRSLGDNFAHTLGCSCEPDITHH